ncbi:MAG TPA: ribonuclease D [Anaerolineaceae bacterium]|nr:ribonuclease D [Anaerolineaceae bacterium]
MNTENIKPAILVEDLTQLSEMVSDLSKYETIGVDTESNSLFEYEEKVCLIQFSTDNTDYLVDTIKLRELELLRDLFSSKKIEKIFHAAEYDLMCLKRDFSFEFNYIFDTMIASRILGYKSIGLSSLLDKFYNLSIEKKFQRADWGKRPISAEMQLYAQLDTHFLIGLRNLLYSKLEENNKLELAKEDFRRITDVDAFVNNKNNENYWRIIKGNSLSHLQESVLIELYYLRENLAKQMNRPPFKVFSNQAIINIAKKMPKDFNQLKSIEYFSPKLVQKYGDKVIDAVKEGLLKNNCARKEKFKPNPSYLRKHDALKQWRKQKGTELSVESDIILPKEHLELLAHLKDSNLQNIKVIMHNIPYRFNKFGEEILSILERNGE